MRQLKPNLEIDGEMQADVALNAELRKRDFPFATLSSNANVLVFRTLRRPTSRTRCLPPCPAASLIGPILVGMKQPANVLQISATTDEVLNMIYVTAHQAAAGLAAKA